MTWTTPRTWISSPADLATKALLDVHVRDNLDHLRTVLPDARGLSVALYLDDSQSITNDTLTAISWTAALWEVGADIWAVSPNPSRVTVTETGKYAVLGTFNWRSTTTGAREAYVRVNAGTYYTLASLQAVDESSKATVHGFYRELSLAASDYVELYVRQKSTVTLGTGESFLSPFFCVWGLPS